MLIQITNPYSATKHKHRLELPCMYQFTKINNKQYNIQRNVKSQRRNYQADNINLLLSDTT